jgi:hypothetical protein
MTDDVMTLTGLVTLALQYEIDHEVWYAHTTSGTVRAKMMLSITGNPTVIVDFGDKKHGQRVSRATVSGSGKIKVNMHDVLQSMSNNAVEGKWRTGEPEPKSINSSIMAPLGEQVSIKGYVNGLVEENDRFFFYSMRAKEYVMNVETREVEFVNEERYTLQIPKTDPSPYINDFGYYSSDPNHGEHESRDMGAIPENMRVEVIGKYRYPDIIEVTNLDY